jgi:hypothetical protein
MGKLVLRKTILRNMIDRVWAPYKLFTVLTPFIVHMQALNFDIKYCYN